MSGQLVNVLPDIVSFFFFQEPLFDNEVPCGQTLLSHVWFIGGILSTTIHVFFLCMCLDLFCFVLFCSSFLFSQGNECVDVKEGTMDTIIETNYCTGQLDEDSAGIDSRASTTIIRYNKIVGCKGAGVRLGGHKVGPDQYGIACQVGGMHFFSELLALCLAERRNKSLKFDQVPRKKICFKPNTSAWKPHPHPAYSLVFLEIVSLTHRKLVNFAWYV